MNNNWYKKEKPLLGLTGLGGGVDGLAVVGAATKTYVDDIFSSYVYTGNESSRSITNGIDNTQGGLVWTKTRTGDAANHYTADTVRGVNNLLRFNQTNAEGTTASSITAFNDNGFSLGTSTDTNWNTRDYASWNFRKAAGFFDIVTWTGNSDTTQTISHSLGSIPGMIIAKRTDSSTYGNWVVYHLGFNGYIRLNLSNSGTSSSDWQDITSTSFRAYDYINVDGASYVAYIFAGGESTAATARSVDFDGSSDYLSLASTSDFAFGTGDFTWECWFKADDDGSYLFEFTDSSGQVDYYTWGGATRRLRYVNSTTGAQEIADVVLVKGSWYHFAAARSSGTTKVFLNGDQKLSFADTHNYGDSRLFLGATSVGGSQLTGTMSNVRVVNGTAVYTSSFRPPTEPLTNITNTKLLCCNNSSTTGSTVSPGTITATGSPTASIDSPFDDPAAFVFGESGSESVIKTGKYTGTGSTGLEINVGFEAQYLLIKNTSRGGTGWQIFDCIRGIVTGGDDYLLTADSNSLEGTNHDYLDITPTGFKLITTSDVVNYDGDNYIYMAIRRPDGYVGKLPSAGTDSFAMDTGNSSTTVPTYDSGFPVDMAIRRGTALTANWFLSARLMQEKDLKPNLTNAEATNAAYLFDSNVGWNYNGDNTDYKSWMWKRNAGFDVVAYDGLSGVRYIPHSLGKAAEMLWIKRRDGGSDEWAVGHEALDSGGWNKYLSLDSAGAEANAYGTFNSTAPTATHFSLSTSSRANYDGQKYIAFLFASVSGISKVGSYSGSASGQTITTGFQPRFIIIKSTSSGRNWLVFDTELGWSSGSNDFELNLNTNSAGWTAYDFGGPTATGFTVTTINADINASGHTYIYYAHA